MESKIGQAGRTVGNEEEHTGREASVHGAPEEFLLVEQQVQMAGRV